MLLVDDVDNGLGYAAGNCKVTAVGRSIVDAVRILLEVFHIDVTGRENAGHLLERQHEIDLASYVRTHCFELLCRARADKRNLCTRLMVLDQSSGQRHRGEGHRDAVGLLREQLLCHHRPRRTAGGCHERQLLRHFLNEVLGFLCRTQVSADGNLDNIRKAEALHGRTQLARCHLRAELADKRRCDSGVNTLACLNGADHLEDLRLVCDCAKRAVYQALTAGNALIVINIRSAVAVAVDGIHAAGCRTRALLTDNGVILADIHAASALDALLLINDRTAGKAVERYGTLRANLHTRMRHAALTAVRDHDLVLLAGMARELDDVDQRRRVVGLLSGRGFDVIRERRVLGGTAARQAHRQTQTFADDSALEENIVADVANLTRHDIVRQCFDAAVGRPLGMVRHARNLGENAVADLLNTGFYTSHSHSLFYPPKILCDPANGSSLYTILNERSRQSACALLTEYHKQGFLQRVFVDFLTITLLQFYLYFLGILLKNNAQTDICLSIPCKIEGFTLDEKREMRAAARRNGAR